MKAFRPLVVIAALSASAWAAHVADADPPKISGAVGDKNTAPVTGSGLTLPAPKPDKSILTGDVTWTGISGYTAPAVFTLEHAGDNFHAAVSIQWWENDDEACSFKLHTRQINKSDANSAAFEACHGNPGNEKWVARRAPNEYITALQVCTTDKKQTAKNKIKGLRLWGKILDPEAGTLGPVNTPDEIKHTHCKKWLPKVECGAGEVVTAIKVYSEMFDKPFPAAPTHTSAKAISLGCRKVERKP